MRESLTDAPYSAVLAPPSQGVPLRYGWLSTILGVLLLIAAIALGVMAAINLTGKATDGISINVELPTRMTNPAVRDIERTSDGWQLTSGPMEGDPTLGVTERSEWYVTSYEASDSSRAAMLTPSP